MDASLHPAYFEAILQGLSRTDDQGCAGPARSLKICTVLRRILQVPVPDVGRAEIARAIGALGSTCGFPMTS